MDATWVFPDIPTKKQAGQRKAHAAHLPDSEPILALYDGTVFGGAKEGHVVTARRICWNNLLEPPGHVEWLHVDPQRVATQDSQLHLGHSRIDTMISEPIELAKWQYVIRSLATSAQSDAAIAGNYREAPSAAAQADAGHVVPSDGSMTAYAQRYLSGLSDTWVHPAIPEDKLANARASFGTLMLGHEIVIALYDGTVFGSSKRGFAVTSRGIYWKNFASDPASLRWADIDAGAVAVERDTLVLGSSRVETLLRQDSVALTAWEKFLQKLARSSRIYGPIDGRRSDGGE